MIERKLIRLVTVMGAAVWLARVVFSRSERRNLDRAMQALDIARSSLSAQGEDDEDTTVPSRNSSRINGLEFQDEFSPLGNR